MDIALKNSLFESSADPEDIRRIGSGSGASSAPGATRSTSLTRKTYVHRQTQGSTTSIQFEEEEIREEHKFGRGRGRGRGGVNEDDDLSDRNNRSTSDIIEFTTTSFCRTTSTTNNHNRGEGGEGSGGVGGGGEGGGGGDIPQQLQTPQLTNKFSPKQPKQQQQYSHPYSATYNQQQQQQQHQIPQQHQMSQTRRPTQAASINNSSQLTTVSETTANRANSFKVNNNNNNNPSGSGGHSSSIKAASSSANSVPSSPVGKSSTCGDLLSVSPNTSSSEINRTGSVKRPVLASQHPPKHPTKITSRIIFLKVGQVDTRNERYDAEAYIECTWEDDQIFKLLCDPNMAKNISTLDFDKALKQSESVVLSQNNLVNLKTIINNIAFLDYDSNLFWSPQLYIENAIGDLKEETRHKLELVEREGSNLLNDPNFNPKGGEYKTLFDNLTVKVWEMRKLRGVFYERLELYDFPMDMQELSITLTSKRNVNEVNIVENPNDPCTINTEDFLDQQEWDLFGHVKTSQKTIYDKWRKYERTGFTVSCFIARKPGYYLYNAYMLIFLITVLGFVPFAFDPTGPQFRCQVTGLLILTSVNFRWIVTQRLPSVPYLTSLDKYAIGSLLFLVLFCVWHSLIGSSLLINIHQNEDKGELRKRIDTYLLFGSASIFLFYNFFYIFWFLKMYKSIKKFHNFSVGEVQKSAKRKDEYERSNDTNNPSSSPGSGNKATTTPLASNENKSNKNLDHQQSTNSNYLNKPSNMKKSRNEKESSPMEPIRGKNTSAINFTDLPKP